MRLPTTTWNLLLCGERLQVLSQRLLLGKADDAGNLAASSPAHGALQLSQAALLPFAWYRRDRSEGAEGPATRFRPPWQPSQPAHRDWPAVPGMTGTGSATVCPWARPL